MKSRSLLLSASLVVVAGVARADGLSDPEADRLLREGQELLERGAPKVNEACDKFDLSLRREDNLNTLALLAFCHERAGKPGKAWNEFRKAELRGPTGEKADFIDRHLKALETKVARARLVAGNHSIDEVKVDNEAVVLEEGHIIADPGDHTVRVVVGGKTFTRNLALSVGGNPDIVLGGDEAPPRPAPAPPAEAGTPPSSDTGGRRTGGFVLAGAGAVAVGLGVYFGLKTLSIKSDADDRCGPKDAQGRCTNDAGAAAARKSDAVLPSWLSTAGLGLGAAGLVAGIYLIATSGGTTTPTAATAAMTGTVRITPSVGPGSLGLTGSF